MAKSIGSRNTSLLRLIEERELSKKKEEETKKEQETPVPVPVQASAPAPYFTNDCISNILIRLPLDSIQSSRFVCKPWYNIINNPIFINTHLHRSESVLVFVTPILKKRPNSHFMTLRPKDPPNTFSVEDSLVESKPATIFKEPILRSPSMLCIKFMEFNNGTSKIGEYKITCFGQIRATCNGLVLLDNKLKKGGLAIINPVTRKIIALPLGTIYPPHDESYGFAFSDVTCEYKVVHLFRDELGFVSCETLNLQERIWKEVNGPPFGLIGWFGYHPVSAIGALHWIPQIDRSDCIVSMELVNEKFLTIPLPHSCRTHDRIIEMGGFLCYLTHQEFHIDVWVLKGLHGDDVWTKQHSITNGCILDMVPVFSLRVGRDIILKRDEDGSSYAYDLKLEEMRKIKMDNGSSYTPSGLYLPHVNSLVSWLGTEDLAE